MIHTQVQCHATSLQSETNACLLRQLRRPHSSVCMGHAAAANYLKPAAASHHPAAQTALQPRQPSPQLPQPASELATRAASPSSGPSSGLCSTAARGSSSGGQHGAAGAMAARHNRLRPLLALLALSLTASAAAWKQGRCVKGQGRQACCRTAACPPSRRSPPRRLGRPALTQRPSLSPLCPAGPATTAPTGAGSVQLHFARVWMSVQHQTHAAVAAPIMRHPPAFPPPPLPARSWSIHKGNCGFGELPHRAACHKISRPCCRMAHTVVLYLLPCRHLRASPAPPCATAGYISQDQPAGWDVAALSDQFPNFSGSCGRCYEVKCDPRWIKDGRDGGGVGEVVEAALQKHVHERHGSCAANRWWEAPALCHCHSRPQRSSARSPPRPSQLRRLVRPHQRVLRRQRLAAAAHRGLVPLQLPHQLVRAGRRRVQVGAAGVCEALVGRTRCCGGKRAALAAVHMALPVQGSTCTMLPWAAATAAQHLPPSHHTAPPAVPLAGTATSGGAAAMWTTWVRLICWFNSGGLDDTMQGCGARAEQGVAPAEGATAGCGSWFAAPHLGTPLLLPCRHQHLGL